MKRTWRRGNRNNLTIITKTGLIERFHSRIVNGIGHEAIYLTHGLDATVDLFEVALVRAVVHFEEETLHATCMMIIVII